MPEGVGKGTAMIDDLIEARDGIPMVSSLEVAKRFVKQHKDVLRAIDSLETSDEFARRNFTPCTYLAGNGRQERMCWMTRDGFSILVMGFTGKEAVSWKERFLEAFNSLENAVREVDAKLPAIPHDYQSLMEVVSGFCREQEARLEAEKKRGQLMIEERASLISRMRSAEKVRDNAVAKMDSVAKHSYKALKELEALYEGAQDDLLSTHEASNVTKLVTKGVP